MVEVLFTEQHELIRKLAHSREGTDHSSDQVEEMEEEILIRWPRWDSLGVKIP